MTGMAILIGILALVLVGAFLTVWLRDKGRSEEVSDDSGRLDADTHTDTDPQRRNQAPGH